MKNSTTRFTSPSRWLLAGSLFVFGLGFTGPLTPHAQAQGAAKAGGRRRGLTKKMLTAVQEKTGKPVTPALRAQLTALAKTRDDAVQAATDKFNTDFAAATGLTVDQVKEITTPARGAGAGAGGRGGKRAGAGDMAPVPAPAPPAPAITVPAK